MKETEKVGEVLVTEEAVSEEKKKDPCFDGHSFISTGEKRMFVEHDYGGVFDDDLSAHYIWYVICVCTKCGYTKRIELERQFERYQGEFRGGTYVPPGGRRI